MGRVRGLVYLKGKETSCIPGWPRKRIDRTSLSVLETGYDIAGFWVARMITVCHRFSFIPKIFFQNFLHFA